MAGGGDEECGPSPPPAPPRKPTPGQPWSHLETVRLIDSYEERWYSLKRGQLKAQQWEEVAAEVAARCGFDSPSKTGTQCRHKIEKLRKRYRAERIRPVRSIWPYFDRMDRMERGPLPISVRPPPQAAAAASSSDEEEDADDDDEDERIASNTRSINGILREGFFGASRNPPPRKRSDFYEEQGEEEEEEEEEEENGNVDLGLRRRAASQLAAAVRGFGDGLVRMEKRRMELMREIENDWMEMETKRAEMVVEAQRCLVETIAGAFGSVKKAKKAQDS
ncbi:uncharacterized protein [Typha angustifolia]|uniref:uncharacterized protein n=1 Tax=Typha angustifolia TaxID=59011 RepID=UPI003C30B9A9